MTTTPRPPLAAADRARHRVAAGYGLGLGCVLAITLGVASPGFGADAVVPIDRHGNFQVSTPIVIGHTVLEPGYYVIREERVADDHFVVVNVREPRPAGKGGLRVYFKTREQVARVQCDVATTERVPSRREIFVCQKPDGARVAAEIRLQPKSGPMIALVPRA